MNTRFTKERLSRLSNEALLELLIDLTREKDTLRGVDNPMVTQLYNEIDLLHAAVLDRMTPVFIGG